MVRRIKFFLRLYNGEFIFPDKDRYYLVLYNQTWIL